MKSLASNKRAKFDFDITDTYDAGLVLTGAEVKALKSGNASLTGSYVKISPTGASLINAHIGAYKYAVQDGYEPTKSRKLLLNKKEINALIGKDKGSTIIPLEIYVGQRNLVKLKIGVGRGRKKEDKREYIKKRDTKREVSKSIDK